MISIILVGKNEGWRLTKSLESCYKMISSYPEYSFEIIYVDSKSSDDSIERAKAFEGIRVFEIVGVTNSAIARNIGVKESRGEILFLIDADMEIEPKFLNHVLDKNNQLKFDYLTGHLDDYFYTVDGEFIEASPRTYKTEIPSNIQELDYNGGLCLINKSIWDRVDGMRNKYKRSQDLDLTIRLKKNGIKIIRIPSLAAKHHTVDYRNEKRMWQNLKQGYDYYAAMIFRDHLFNIDVIKRTLRSYYTAFLLIFLCLSLFTVNQSIVIYVALFYLIILFLRLIIHTKKAKSTKNKVLYFLERILLQFFLDISFWTGFLFFYPKNKSVQYKIRTKKDIPLTDTPTSPM